MTPKLEAIYQALFHWEFCDPPEKTEAEEAFNDLLQKACDEFSKPRYVLEPAILKCYREYRYQRLRNEMPMVPPTSRVQ